MSLHYEFLFHKGKWGHFIVSERTALNERFARFRPASRNKSTINIQTIPKLVLFYCYTAVGARVIGLRTHYKEAMTRSGLWIIWSALRGAAPPVLPPPLWLIAEEVRNPLRVIHQKPFGTVRHANALYLFFRWTARIVGLCLDIEWKHELNSKFQIDISEIVLVKLLLQDCVRLKGQ